ncbi:MAG: GNAT family N-acetyltransferase [Eubacterium sp.]
MYGINLETDNFYLKDFNLQYAKDIFEGCVSQSDVMKFLNFEPYTDFNDYKRFMQNTIERIKEKGNTEYRWLIIPKNEDIAIGILSANQYELGYKLGYYIRKSAQGKGVMTEIMNFIIQYLFSIGVDTVFSIHDIENIASGKLMDKCGMKLVSVETNHTIRKGFENRTMITKAIRNDYK